MHNKFKFDFFILILLSFVCFSCTNIGNKGIISEFKDINPREYEGKESLFLKSDKQPIKIKVNQFEDHLWLNFSTFVDSIWYVKLSNEESAVIGTINKVEFYNNCIYIQDRYKTKSIKKFSINGDYLSAIGRYGGGPGEYAEPTDFVITDNEVIVYDQFNVRLNYYDHQGKFLKSKRLPFLFFKFYQFSSNQYVFFSLGSIPLSKHLYFEFSIKHLLYRCIYSNESNKLIVGNDLINDINYIFTFTNILTSINGNILVGYNQSYDIAETQQRYSREETVKLIGEENANIADGIHFDDNPILVFFKLKDF